MMTMSRKAMFGRFLVLFALVSSIFFFGCGGGGGKAPADTLLDEYDTMITDMEKSAAAPGDPAKMAEKATEQAKKIADWSTKYQEELKKATPEDVKKYTERFNTITARMAKMGAGS